jgi:hypothetical protein
MFGFHTPYRYANFGFKSVNHHTGKYGDRSLYNVKLKKSLGFELIQSFSVQKAGNAISECEDIWQKLEHNHMMVIALADGATESSFAREWAKELVNAFVVNPFVDRGKANWLSPMQTNWQRWLIHQNLSWFAKRKAGEGTFATFLSLEIGSDLNWKALAVGDSCLFVVRDRLLQISFPLQNSHEFNNRPRLIGTHVKTANIHFSQVDGDAQIGDRFYLTTDAIACWIFKQLESNQDPWLKLDQISSPELFAKWVSELRDRHEIANDDTTLLCLKIRCES